MNGIRAWLAAITVGLANPALGEPLFDFAVDEGLAFRREAVDAFAEGAYRRRLATLSLRGRVDAEPVLLERANTALARVLAAAESERPGVTRMDWQLHTCWGCGESASAAAGGGLMLGEEFVEQLAFDDDELGFLIAHEVAHILAEHTREFAGAARYFVDNGLAREYWDIQRELDASLPVQFRLAFLAEQQELEADRIGLFLGARAGYEPSAMLTLLGKLTSGVAGAGPATHPGSERRIQQVSSALQAARVVLARARQDGPRGGFVP